MTEQMPSWLRGTLSKHERDAMDCLRDLLNAASKRGHCTAEDIEHYPSQKNVIGSVFKRLPACGLVQTDERVKPRDKAKHGRKLYVWKVQDWARLGKVQREIVNMNRETLLQEPAQSEGQFLLAM